MLTYSILAQVTGAPAKAVAWAREVAELVKKKTGITVNVSSRLGGPNQIIWVAQYDDFAAFEKAQGIMGADADYAKLVQASQDAHLFEATSVDTAFWMPI